MGIDLRLRGLAAEADIDGIRAVLDEHDKHGWVTHEPGDRYLYIESLHRMFAPGYERGHWPSIRAMLVALQPLVPQLEYGGDDCHPFYGEEVCEEMLRKRDELWSTSTWAKLFEVEV